MLKEMNIENFALIESLHLEFKKGFTIISGETGSGKSILIDAICFILGCKYNKNIVRNGEEKTVVEGVFDIEHEKINEILDENGINKDDYVVIRREGHINGKSIIRVNSKVVTLNVLKTISKYLMDIHTQHQNYELLNNSKHINYLDRYIGSNLCLNEYIKIYNEWNLVKNKINEIQNNELNESYLDYVKFQINELDKANLNENEEEELNNKIKLLNNSEKINKAIKLSLDFLTNNEQCAINHNLRSLIKSLSSIENILDEVKSILVKLDNLYYELEEIICNIKNIENNINFNIDEFNTINSRIYTINGFKKKFNKSSVKELLLYNQELHDYLEEALNKENILENLKIEENNLYKKLVHESDKITSKRKKYALEIENEIIDQLNYMGMENIVFKINIEKDINFNLLGNDNVEFYISTNKGEPLKNLSKIVSGGELSRIMLALKIVFLGNEPISGIVFDEIDTGVSGKIAQKVGKKMYYLSSKCQVFCITHLPQIASLSDNHYLAVKKIKDDKTYTEIRDINKDEKINEIAKMIGGENISDSAFLSAMELIGNKKILE